jgi:DNA polymerase-3 subunit gamma/tau
VLGDALAAMAEAVDQRIVLEAALVRLASVEADTSPAALLERIERLERALAGGAAPSPRAAPAEPTPPAVPTPRAARTARAPAPTAPTAPTTPAPAAPVAAPSGDLPTRDDITLAWGDELLAKIPRAAKARYTAGRFVEVGDRGAVFAVPNAAHAAKCEDYRADVERVLADHFGRAVPLVLVVENAAASPVAPAAPPASAPAATRAPEPVEEPVDEQDEVIDVHELADAPPDNRTSVDQLTDAFPGAELLPEGEGD